MSQIDQRIHALDAVRSFALLLGIILHATLSFHIKLGGNSFPIEDSQPSLFLTIVAFVIHIFRMSTFFIVAAFFAHLVFHRRGGKAFVLDRCRRILGPLALFWYPVAYVLGLSFIWASIKSNGVVVENLIENTSVTDIDFWHLWFLYILLWLYTLSLILRSVLSRLDPQAIAKKTADSLFNQFLKTRVGLFILSMPIAVALFLIPEWSVIIGVPSPESSLFPTPSSLFIYFYVFGLGWLIERQRHILQIFQEKCGEYWGVGGTAALLCGVFSGLWISPEEYIGEISSQILSAVCYSFALLAWSFAFIGTGMPFFSQQRAVVRYFADASYWIYIMHLPLVYMLQVWLMDINLHWVFKFIAINLLTFLPLIVSYHYCVRSTWIGALLNGKRIAQ